VGLQQVQNACRGRTQARWCVWCSQEWCRGCGDGDPAMLIHYLPGDPVEGSRLKIAATSASSSNAEAA